MTKNISKFVIWLVLYIPLLVGYYAFGMEYLGWVGVVAGCMVGWYLFPALYDWKARRNETP